LNSLTPPHSWRISKLSQKYWCDKHRQRAARKRTPSAVHTMDAANAFGLAGDVHSVSAASLAAGSNSTVPLDQFYWICRACSYTNQEDISRVVFGNTDEDTHICVICYTSSPNSSKDVDSEVKDKLVDSTK
jgi:hypothetical protein